MFIFLRSVVTSKLSCQISIEIVSYLFTWNVAVINNIYFCIIAIAEIWCPVSYQTETRNIRMSFVTLRCTFSKRLERYMLYGSCNRDIRWDFASSENNDNVVFPVMGQRHEGKLEWLLKEIRSPKENCRLSREAFLMFWFFVESLWNMNPKIRILVLRTFRLESSDYYMYI